MSCKLNNSDKFSKQNLNEQKFVQYVQTPLRQNSLDSFLFIIFLATAIVGQPKEDGRGRQNSWWDSCYGQSNRMERREGRELVQAVTRGYGGRFCFLGELRGQRKKGEKKDKLRVKEKEWEKERVVGCLRVMILR